MRVHLLFGTIASCGLLLGVACSSTAVTTPFGQDAGGSTSGEAGASTSSTSSTSSSGGSSNGAIPVSPTKLRDGATVLIDVTADDQVIYLAEGANGNNPTLEALPAEGGTPEVIASSFDVETDFVIVSGGAVAWWNALNADQLTGTINVWTKKNGKRLALNTKSNLGDFVATEDGSRLAFSIDVDADIGNIAVADSATVAAPLTGVLADADRVNLLAFTSCTPQYGFAKQAFIATFCTGNVQSETNAHLYYVGAGSTSAVRLDTAGAATGNVVPFFFANDDGTSIFAISNGAASTARLITPPAGASAATSVSLEDGVAATGFMSSDGKFAIYRSATGGLRRASTTGAPNPKALAPGAKGLLDVTVDRSHLIYRTLAATDTGTDIHSADTSTEGQTGVPLVTTATATPLGITGNGQHVLYLTDIGGSTGNTLNSQPVAGGAAKEVAQSLAGIAITPVGNGALLRIDARSQGEITYTSIKYLNVVTGDTSPVISEAVPAGGIGFTKTRFVYTRLTSTGAGLYAAPFPQ